MRFRIRANCNCVNGGGGGSSRRDFSISRLLVTLTYMTDTLRWHALINGIRYLTILPPHFLFLSLALVLVTRSRHKRGLQAPVAKTE